ncbi:MAG: toprim domain-containing protein [Thalassotalea sp.]|nr:toprim domain-containing protein [Thalassotalea sp.]
MSNPKSKKRFLDANDIAQQAKGRWIEILGGLAASELGSAVENFSGKYATGSRYYCPVHGGKSGEAFTLYKDADVSGGGVCNSCGAQPDGFKLLMWIKGWDYREALEKVADELNIQNSGNAPKASLRKAYVPKPLTKEELAEAKKLCNKRDDIISECVPINHWSAKPAQRYFARRGFDDLRILSKEVMFHKGLPSWFYDKKSEQWIKEGVYPCIVSIIRNSKSEVMNIHRTFISDDGFKAPIKSPRKLGAAIVTHPVSGCSIQLNPSTSTMAVAEGLETTLAVKATYSDLAVNCTLNAELMKNWQPPIGCNTVFIFADLDATQTGEVAAQTLYDKLNAKGLTCYICLPEPEANRTNIDWADVLEMYGTDGFPDLPGI